MKRTTDLLSLDSLMTGQVDDKLVDMVTDKLHGGISFAVLLSKYCSTKYPVSWIFSGRGGAPTSKSMEASV